MKVIDLLKKEHDVILENMAQLEIHLGELPQSLPAIPGYLDFVRQYVDKFHHQKEEDILFKWLVEKDPIMRNGPVGVMLEEHDEGRALVASATEACDLLLEAHQSGGTPLEGLDSGGIATVKDSLSEFLELLNAHIDKENMILYEMANQLDCMYKDGDLIMEAPMQKVIDEYTGPLSGIPSKP